MTREEAKRTLEFFSVCSENHVTIAVNSRDRQAIDMAIKALEAQILKPPTVRDRHNPNLCHLYCPTCGIWVGIYNKRINMYNMQNKANGKMCAKCGQALNLSELPYGGE